MVPSLLSLLPPSLLFLLLLLLLLQLLLGLQQVYLAHKVLKPIFNSAIC